MNNRFKNIDTNKNFILKADMAGRMSCYFNALLLFLLIILFIGILTTIFIKSGFVNMVLLLFILTIPLILMFLMIYSTMIPMRVDFKDNDIKLTYLIHLFTKVIDRKKVILKPTKNLFGIDAIEFRIKGKFLSKKLLESTYDVISSVSYE